MRQALPDMVVPYLKTQGFSGSFPCFRRQSGEQQQLLDFQFNRFGRSFAVNLSVVEPHRDFHRVSINDLKVLRCQRLGSRKKRMKQSLNMDHWFTFLKGFLVYFPAYRSAAKKLIQMYEQEAELIFADLQQAIDSGVSCIHLSERLP